MLFHRFPAKREIADDWKFLLGLPKEFDHNGRFVCSKHFAPGDIQRG